MRASNATCDLRRLGHSETIGSKCPFKNFWNAPVASEPPSPAPRPGWLRFADTTALGAAVGTLPPGRILSLTGAAARSGRIGCRQSCPPCRSRNPACNSSAGLGPLSDQCPLELRHGTQHVRQKPRGRILEIRIGQTDPASIRGGNRTFLLGRRP